jgi:hypothetical protein
MALAWPGLACNLVYGVELALRRARQALGPLGANACRRIDLGRNLALLLRLQRAQRGGVIHCLL